MMKSNIGRIPIFLDELEKLDDKNIRSIVQYVHDAGLSDYGQSSSEVSDTSELLVRP